LVFTKLLSKYKTSLTELECLVEKLTRNGLLAFARPCTQRMFVRGLFCEYRHSLELLSRNAHIKFYISLAFHVPLWYVTVWCVFKNNKIVRVLRICICLNFHLKSDYAITMRLHHSRDGSTYLRYKLMCFVYFVLLKNKMPYL
jgi:hypothetical protein